MASSKRCRACGIVKPLSQFRVCTHKDPEKRAFRHPYCEGCQNERASDYLPFYKTSLDPEDIPLMGDGEIEEMIDYRLEGDKLT